MTKSLSMKIVSIILFVLCVALLITGIYGTSLRTSSEGEELLKTMRLRALLSTTGEGAEEAYIAAMKKAATEKAKADGGGMEAIREAVAKAEEEARAQGTSSVLLDYDAVDTDALDLAIGQLVLAQADYAAEEARAVAAYAETVAAETPKEIVDDVPVEDALPDADGDVGEAELEIEGYEEPQIDLSGFQATAEMLALETIVDEKYALLTVELSDLYEGLDADSFSTLKQTILALIYQHDAKYEDDFDRYSAANGVGALSQSDALKASVIRYGDDLVTVGVALAILGLLILFYPVLLKKLGLPRLIIGLFFLLLCVLSVIYDLSITGLLSNTIVRMGMNSVLVLAMVPAIQCGISLNLGLPLGIIGGLLGGLLCIEFGFSGWFGFFFAIAVGIVISAVLGYLYGLLLNRLKGNEMAVTTYVGFSVVSLMCIGWMMLPFKSMALKWPLGNGLRVTLSLAPSYRRILNNFLSFDIAGITIPTGLLLFMGLCCLLVWLFLRSKTGVAMQAVGANPRFAEATGISVDKMRIIGTTISTVLGAVGIIVYSQSYGFMQLYSAPRQMGFIAASAILIGGASTSRARISHVLIGTFLFQGVLTLGMPVANVLVPQSTISETLRILISNGIILYALTKSGGANRG